MTPHAYLTGICLSLTQMNQESDDEPNSTDGNSEPTNPNSPDDQDGSEVTASQLNLGKDPSAEQVGKALMGMKMKDYITGNEVSKISPKFSNASLAVDKVTRVDKGLKLELTAAGRLAVTLARNVHFKNGSILEVSSVNFVYGKHSYSALHVYSSGNTIGFDKQKIPVDIYNLYTQQWINYSV